MSAMTATRIPSGFLPLSAICGTQPTLVLVTRNAKRTQRFGGPHHFKAGFERYASLNNAQKRLVSALTKFDGTAKGTSEADTAWEAVVYILYSKV
jgi:hypothetical protein